MKKLFERLSYEMCRFWSFLWWRVFPPKLRIFRDAMRFSLNFLAVSQWTSTRHARQSVSGSSSTPIPWITYPAYQFLNSLDFRNSSVLEFGGGASSIWWANRCKSLLVVEHNSEWFLKTRTELQSFPNANITYAHSQALYVSQLESQSFEVVVIDGEYREQILVKLKDLILNQKCEPKLIIIDNSERIPEIINRFSQEINYTSVEFKGMGPINTYSWSTLVLIRGSII